MSAVAGSSAGGSSTVMTFRRFLEDFRQFIRDPQYQDQLAAFVELLEQNDNWIWTNRNQLSGRSFWSRLVFKNNLTEDDMREVVRFMRYCQEERLASTQEVRHAVYWLYCLLVYLSDNDRMKRIYCNVQLVEAVCQHLISVQADYMNDELLGETVQNGLTTICNCDTSQSLWPILRQQAGPTLKLYSDPQSNDPHKVIEAVRTLEVIEAHEELQGRDWPDGVFTAVTELIQRSQYFEEFKGYRVHYKQDGTGVAIPASTLMICLTGLSRSRGHACKMMRCLTTCKDQIEEFIQAGGKQEKYYTRAFLRRMPNHSCSECGGADSHWIAGLLQEAL